MSTRLIVSKTCNLKRKDMLKTDFIPLSASVEAKLYQRGVDLWIRCRTADEVHEEISDVQARIVFNYLAYVTNEFTIWRYVTRWDVRAMARAYSDAWVSEAYDLFLCTAPRVNQLSNSPEFWLEMQRYGTLINFSREVFDRTLSKVRHNLSVRGYSYAPRVSTVGRILYFAAIWASYGMNIARVRDDERIAQQVAALKGSGAWMDAVASKENVYSNSSGG